MTASRLRARSSLLTLAAAALMAGTATGVPAAYAVKPGSGSATGTGRIFMVNPVQSSGNQNLTDMKSSTAQSRIRART